MTGVITDTARRLSGAQDRQVAQVVALIDALQDRGDTDAVIAPLRRRLQRIRPARPPRFGRILFDPLGPVIVPPKHWRPGDATMPRPALGVFKTMVQAALGARAEAIDQLVARYAGAPAEAPSIIGPIIWPAAALCLRHAADLPPPADWNASGLPAETFRPLCAATARVLQYAPLIETWVFLDSQGQAIPPKGIESLLTAATAGHAESASLAAVLIARLPRCTPDILRALQVAWPSAAFGPSPLAGLALNAATQYLRGIAEGGISSAPLSELSRTTDQAVLLLDAMLKDAGPRRREELERLGRSLEQQCRERFTDSLAADVVAPACAVSEAEAAREVPKMEEAARDLRRLQDAVKRIGGGAAYDAMLRRAAEAIHELPAESQLTPADRIRLAEILAGSEAAMRLFALG